jgi:hypothetical protein
MDGLRLTPAQGKDSITVSAVNERLAQIGH